MAGEIVHDDDVSGAQLRDEHLGDVGLEGIAVDRGIQDKRRDEAAQGERADEGRGLPAAMRDADAQALAPGQRPWRRTIFVDRPGLVDEHQALGIKVESAVELSRAFQNDVGTTLLARMSALFFARDLVAPEEALERAEAEDEALRGERLTGLLDRQVAVGAERGEDRVLVGVDAMGLAVAAERLRASVALLAFARPPPADLAALTPKR